MSALPGYLLDASGLLLWTLLWALGGIWLAAWAFHLRPAERALTGFALGFILQAWLANLLAQFLPVLGSFWLGSGLVFVSGLICEYWRHSAGWPWQWLGRQRIGFAGQWLALLLITAVFTQVGRGLAILDDYQNLTITSLLAAGDIPPHFALNPSVSFGYHHLLLLQAAQLMRVAGMYPWSALDLARGLAFALCLLLTALWVQRVTRSRLAGFLGAAGAAFFSGSRWLLLLLPPAWLEALSKSISLTGSGAQSGASLAAALLGEWAIEGDGPLAFPFAFVNSFTNPRVMVHNGTGALPVVFLLLLLLTASRWRGLRGALITAALLAAFALTSETVLVLLGGGLLLAALLTAVRRRSLRLPRELWLWLGALAFAGILGVLQGGVLTSAAAGFLAKLLPSESTAPAYHSFQFALGWPPALFSGHLGQLSLLNPAQLLVALLEIGPLLLVLPFTVLWGVRALRAQHWFEAAFAFSGLLGLLFLLVRFTGPAGASAVTRLQMQFVTVCSVFALPCAWWWGRRRGEGARITTAALGLLAVFGGLVLFAIELVAAQKPVYSYFLTSLDVSAARDHWNRLEPGALVFDPLPVRAVTIFARPTRSSASWYQPLPEWEQLAAAPDPARLRAAGFSYVYLGQQDWDALPLASQSALQAACVQRLDEYTDWTGDFRWLLDIRACP